MPLTETDRQLVNSLLTGSATGWTNFVDRYSGLVTQIIRHTSHAHSLKLSDNDMDDLTSEVFAALLERDMAVVRGFRGRSSFATYLAVVVRRITLRKLTQRRYMQAFGHVQVHQASIEADSESAHVDAKDEVESLMTRLPQQLRQVVGLFFLKGRSYQQISERLGIPVNSVGPMLARAKSLLRSTDRSAT